MMIDRKEIDILISEKEKELSMLRENMQKLNQLSALNSEIEEVKKPTRGGVGSTGGYQNGLVYAWWINL